MTRARENMTAAKNAMYMVGNILVGCDTRSPEGAEGPKADTQRRRGFE